MHFLIFAPPCLLISRLIVEGVLDNLAAMSLMLRFATSPLDISSLSSSESANSRSILNAASAAWRRKMMLRVCVAKWRRKPGVAGYRAVNSVSPLQY